MAPVKSMMLIAQFAVDTEKYLKLVLAVTVWEDGIAEDAEAQDKKLVHCAAVQDKKNGNTRAELAGKPDKWTVEIK